MGDSRGWRTQNYKGSSHRRKRKWSGEYHLSFQSVDEIIGILNGVIKGESNGGFQLGIKVFKRQSICDTYVNVDTTHRSCRQTNDFKEFFFNFDNNCSLFMNDIVFNI